MGTLARRILRLSFGHRGAKPAKKSPPFADYDPWGSGFPAFSLVSPRLKSEKKI